ncbi:MAG: hypothetical protein GY749_44290 [Desulfobacteraceae bacterium]|nr:hypothetical protein [Desulfobacteraceae bacterium]
MKSIHLWEKTVVLINPLLVVSSVLTLILIWHNTQLQHIQLGYYYFNFSKPEDFHNRFRLSLLTLTSFEFARQWLSFRRSKFASGITALGFTMLFLAITGLLEKPEEFNSLKYLLAIHVIMLLIYLLKHIRKSRLRISQ